MWFVLFCLSLSSTVARVQLSSEQRDFTCKTNQIKCGDDTCIPFGGNCGDGSTQLHKTRERRDMTLEPKSVCVLPPYPEHGTYKVTNVEDAQPGQTFDSVVLTVSCRRGYGVATTDDEGSEMAKQVYCINGLWLQPIPKCVRFCKVNPDPSIRFMCLVPGAGFKACPTYVQPGTSAKPICNDLYQSSDELGYITCRFGFWDNIPHCKAECGLITPEGEQLIIDGTPVKRGELPWHVGIYRKTTEPYEQICGGSLVSNNVVLSAAHCFWHDVEKLLPSSNYAVAIGKLHRSWNSENDIAWQESDVKEIIIPDLFKGESTNVQDDIAVVILLTPFIYKTYVKPVCLSFEANFDTYQLQPGKYGKVAGWGLTKVDGTPSAILKFVNMPYINTDICIDSVPPAFTRFITSDKFCAGYTNGTALCKGDSGGGLAFAEREQGQLRYYLRGIVSTAPRSDNYECNNSTYITFTKIRKHEDFIKKSLAASVNKTCPWYLFQCNDGACIDQGADCNGKKDCEDGSDESEELCSPETDSIDGLACILPNPPNFGEYSIKNSSSIPTPGRRFKSVVIHVQCHRWYTIVTADGRTTGSRAVACVNGKWSDTLPECLDYCSVDSDPSVRYKCRHPITNKIMVCNKYKKPDTECIPQTNYHVRPDPEIKCASNSSEDGVVLCKEDCGRVTVRKVQAKTGGKQVTRKYMPWHVSIYEKNGHEYLYYCGGTMISNNVIISAADRFWDEEKGYIRLSEWGAAAGQIYRLWDDERNVNAQKSDVKAITVPDTYVGKSQGYKYDVAVLVLLDSFIFNTYVRHVCLDWEPELDTHQLQEGNVGKIAGWGRADDNSPITQQIIKVPNVADYICENLPWAQLGQTCSKYKDKDLQFLNSNLGSGLVFAHNDSGVNRYYLRGILTSKCLKDELCYLEQNYVTHTRISYLKEFIKYYTLLYYY